MLTPPPHIPASAAWLELVSTRRCAIVASLGQIVSMLARPVYTYAEIDRLLRTAVSSPGG